MSTDQAAILPRTRLRSLTGLRAVAASAIFFVHIEFALTATVLRPVYASVYEVGLPGVTLFFVLSGYLLAQAPSFRGGARSFYRRRIARILPVYLCVLCLGVVLLTLQGMRHHSGNAQLGAWNVASNALLLQAWSWRGTSASIVGPAWTLSVEVAFYLLLPFSIGWFACASRARPRAVLCCLVVGCAVSAILMTAHALPLTFPPAYLPVFALGGYMAITNPRPVSVAAAAALCVLGIGVYVVALHALGIRSLPAFATTAIPFALLVQACARRDEAREGELLRPTRGLLGSDVVVRFGLWSYAFYLIHTLIIFVTNGIISTPPQGLAQGLGLVLFDFVCSWSAAAFHYRHIEERCRLRLTA